MKERERIIEKICPVCNKIFIPAKYHAYKSKGRLVCTYSCMLKSDGEQKKKELDYCAGSYENTRYQYKRYSIMARRTETDEWSCWTEVDELDRALHHLENAKSLGYLAKIVEMPIEVYKQMGAKEALNSLRNYIIENKIKITSGNFDLIMAEVMQDE